MSPHSGAVRDVTLGLLHGQRKRKVKGGFNFNTSLKDASQAAEHSGTYSAVCKPLSDKV